jgi:SAM-dependent methyltransferase
VDDVTDAWRARAAQWLDFARTPGHDVFFFELNLPWFAELLPAAGRRTLDIGCGEGRLGRFLVSHGHAVCGIDSSPLLVDAARAAGGYDELVRSDACTAPLPWGDGSFDLAVAHMVLQDMTDPAGCIAEAARVLGPDGVFCLAIPHPVNAPAASRSRYFDATPGADTFVRDGLTMEFVWIDRPLSFYTEALARSGFVIERVREPRPSAETVSRHPALASARDAPFFMHLHCRRVGRAAIAKPTRTVANSCG